jgi:hypothetical protein
MTDSKKLGTVYIAQKQKTGGLNQAAYDVSPALEYGGKIEFLFDAYENASMNPLQSLEQVRHKLKDFDPDIDYIALAGGDPYCSLLIGFVINELRLPIRYLRFERLRQRPTITEDGKVIRNDGSIGYYVPVEMPSNAYID